MKYSLNNKTHTLTVSIFYNHSSDIDITQGPFSECETNTYGKECRNQCGHCIDSTDCFHVNGTCLDGCGAGYFGNECKTRNAYFLHLLASIEIPKDKMQNAKNIKDKQFFRYLCKIATFKSM